MDCGRPNCLLCLTKTLTGKDKKKDCTKRNILYELKCLTCEEKIRTEIEGSEDDEEIKKEKLKNMKVPRYVGESSRSAYERGFEHLDKLTTMNSKSQMLRHLVDMHEGQEFEEVKWGMFILKYLRTAFERQIEEAVHIQQGAETGNILNSKSEYNQSSIPRLVTKIGDKETEMKEWEKEIKTEKEKEEKLEEKIRQLRKEKNKTRLQRERNIQPRKKRRTEDSYITVRSTWGPPPPMAPKKNVAEEKIEPEFKKRKIVEETTNVENKEKEREIEVEEEVEKRNWEQLLANHKERLENEALEKEKEIEDKEIKEKSWELYNQCKDYLEKNEKNWTKRKLERELEMKRKERLQIARKKQDDVRSKVKERKLEKDIAEGLEKLPNKERNKIEAEEQRKKNLDLAETKKQLWKLRSKSKKFERKDPNIDKLNKLKKLEEKLELINKIIKEQREEEIERKKEEVEKKEKINRELKKKAKAKEKRDQEKKERLIKQEMLSRRWEMLRWITNFIDEHKDSWEEERKMKEEEAYKELEEWNRFKRGVDGKGTQKQSGV